MSRDDSIEVRGLSRWLEPDPRPHHLDLEIRAGPNWYRACLVAQDPKEYTVYLHTADGRAVRDNGSIFSGDMEGAIMTAIALAADVSGRPELIVGGPEESRATDPEGAPVGPRA